jgi:hypothetical protein
MNNLEKKAQPMIYPANLENFNSNILYFRLHKNDKRVHLDMHISNLQILTDFIFLCSLQYKQFHIKACRLHNLICADLFSDF